MKKISAILIAIICLSIQTKAQALKVGDVLPNLALTSTAGTVYNLKNQPNAKGFILVFMSPNCDHCTLYENRVIALHQKYKPKGYGVVAIGPYGDDAVKYPFDAMPAMKKLAARKHFTFPYLADEKFKYTWLLGIAKTPTAVVLKKQANGFLIKYIGIIDDEEDENKVPKQKFVEIEVNKLLK